MGSSQLKLMLYVGEEVSAEVESGEGESLG